MSFPCYIWAFCESLVVGTLVVRKHALPDYRVFVCTIAFYQFDMQSHIDKHVSVIAKLTVSGCPRAPRSKQDVDRLFLRVV